MIAFMATDDNGLVTVRLTARVWSGIDGGVDNAISLAAVAGEEGVVAMGSGIRQAGWDQVPWVDGEWPPMGQIIAISLAREQWIFAVDEARESLPVYEEIGDDESADLGRQAIVVITNALG